MAQCISSSIGSSLAAIFADAGLMPQCQNDVENSWKVFLPLLGFSLVTFPPRPDFDRLALMDMMPDGSILENLWLLGIISLNISRVTLL